MHLTETVNWDSPKGNVSWFVWMSQDHMCYNMSVVSIEVHGIMDLDALVDVLCPESGNVLGRLSLQETLMKYLKLKDGNPMVAKLHQRGPQGPVDMVIPNTSEAEARSKMFNKQPAEYLYHVLPLFGATELFIKTILWWSMDAGLAMEVPRCKYNKGMQILTTLHDAQQESILSNVLSLPFFRTLRPLNRQQVLIRKGRIRSTLHPKCVFRLAAPAVCKLCMVPTMENIQK